MAWFIIGTVALFGLGMWIVRTLARENGPETFILPLKPHCSSCGVPLAPMSRWRALSLMPVFLLLDLTLLPALALRWMNLKVIDLLAWLEVPILPADYRCGVCAQWHDDDEDEDDGEWEPPTAAEIGYVKPDEFPGNFPFMCNQIQYRYYVPLIVAVWEEKQFGLTGWWWDE